MRACKDIDAVDLVEAQPTNRAAEMTAVDDGRPRAAEALRRERNAARLGERNAVSQSRSIRRAAQA